MNYQNHIHTFSTAFDKYFLPFSAPRILNIYIFVKNKVNDDNEKYYLLPYIITIRLSALPVRRKDNKRDCPGRVGRNNSQKTDLPY